MPYPPRDDNRYPKLKLPPMFPENSKPHPKPGKRDEITGGPTNNGIPGTNDTGIMWVPKTQPAPMPTHNPRYGQDLGPGTKNPNWEKAGEGEWIVRRNGWIYKVKNGYVVWQRREDIGA